MCLEEYVHTFAPMMIQRTSIIISGVVSENKKTFLHCVQELNTISDQKVGIVWTTFGIPR